MSLAGAYLAAIERGRHLLLLTLVLWRTLVELASIGYAPSGSCATLTSNSKKRKRCAACRFPSQVCDLRRLFLYNVTAFSSQLVKRLRVVWPRGRRGRRNSPAEFGSKELKEITTLNPETLEP